jgi:hypothetical protein
LQLANSVRNARATIILMLSAFIVPPLIRKFVEHFGLVMAIPGRFEVIFPEASKQAIDRRIDPFTKVRQ